MSISGNQLLVFCYHKSGTVLFEHVMGRVAARLGLMVATRYGLVTTLDRRTDIFIIAHSLLGFDLDRPFRAVRIVRDPRDIWVSSYLYHRRCGEGWCVNTGFSPASPITYPRVDFSFQHRPEAWKQDYLRRLGGRSYQQNLLDRDQDAGLAFELDGYTGCTLEAMQAWQLRQPELLTVQLEAISRDFDAVMMSIFRHFGFSAAACAVALEEAAQEDLARMDDATIAANPHVHSRDLSKWRRFLTPAQITAFEERYGELILSLGYQLA
jgi:hypothetical protein